MDKYFFNIKISNFVSLLGNIKPSSKRYSMFDCENCLFKRLTIQ